MKELLKKMTLKEKIGQMMQLSPFFFIADLEKEAAGPIRELDLNQEKIFSAGSILGVGSSEEMVAVQKKYLSKNRLGIPLIFMADIIHGYKTIFPVPLALASSWNREVVKTAARISAIEASSSGIHMTFSPMADLVRDPRWGRCVESFGESPLLVAEFSKAMVEGYQQNDLKKTGNLGSCVKHFAGYGAVEGGRDYNTVDLSLQTLHSTHFAGYRSAIESGCVAIMTAFNLFEGVPCTINKDLLQKVLRDQWHFSGITISDYDSLHEVISHGVAENSKDAAAMGIEAGLDIEMASTCYINHLETLVNNHQIDLNLIDEAVLRILELKKQLGLFENPYKGAIPSAEQTMVRCPEFLSATKKAATESAVLLQNDGTLPLSTSQKIAILGPYAASTKTNGPWSWHGYNDNNASLNDVLLSRKIPVVFSKPADSLEEYTDHDIDRIRQADILLLALGEPENWSGEAHSRADISLPGKQASFVEFAATLNKKAVVLLQNGRPLILDNILCASAILETWFLGSMASEAICDLLYGIANPSGKLPMSFPRSHGQIPIYYNALQTGRPNTNETHPQEYVSKYLDSPNSPLFPFGYGLSYSTFHCSNLCLSAKRMKENDSLVVSITLENQSPIDGTDVIQVYLGDPVARISRPVRELIAFRKISLKGNEKTTVSFELTKKELSYRLKDGSLVTDPGKFILYVGDDPNQLLQNDFFLE